MKKVLFLLLILCIAATSQKGKVTITLINRAPRLTSLTILPVEPYYDSVLKCHAEIDDESPKTVKFEYVWHKNNILQDEKSSEYSDVDDNDFIRCLATPIDKYGEKGNTETAETIILPSPTRVKVIKPVLNLVGIDISAKDLESGTSMAGITGMVTGVRGNSSVTVVFLLGIFLMILIALNVLGLIIRKFRYPKPGSQNA